MKDLKKYLTLKKRAVLLFIYMYDLKQKKLSDEDKKKYIKIDEIIDECKNTEKMGLETWNVIFKINKKEITVDKIRKIHLID